MASSKYRALLSSFFVNLPSPQIPPGSSPSGPYVGTPADPPVQELQQGEMLDFMADGPRPAPSRYIMCTVSAAEAVGHSVYVSGRDATNDCPTVLKCDPSNTAKMPAIGQVVKLFGLAAVVLVPAGCEFLPGSALTVGAHYYVGSDGLPAKTGDANVPAGGHVKQSLGVAISTKCLLRIPGLPCAATW